MKIHLQVDEANDQLYLGLRTPLASSVDRTVEVTPDVFADLDADGRLLGLDIGNASAHAEDGTLHSVTFESLIGVKEAAAVLGMQKSNFVRDVASNPAFPSPVVTLASGRIWLRSQVEAYAARRSPPSRRSRPALARPRPSAH